MTCVVVVVVVVFVVVVVGVVGVVVVGIAAESRPLHYSDSEAHILLKYFQWDRVF